MKRRRSQRVEVACPHCAHLQWESVAAVSSFCRGCGAHFEINRGRTTSNRPGNPGSSTLRLASDDLWNGGATLLAPSPKSAGNGTGRPNSTYANGSRNESAEPPREVRTVACFECGQEQEVNASAVSATCAGCNAHISLRNVHVRNDSRQKIKTKGDVTVHHNASLQGSNLCCRNLKVMGTISGNVECTGNASFHSDCEVRGVLSCAVLRVRKNIVVHFEHAVNAREIEIAGDAFGHFYCSEGVIVGEGGVLRGEVIARTIEIAPAGSLEASLRIYCQDTSSKTEKTIKTSASGDTPATAADTAQDDEEPSVWDRGKISPASA